MREIKVRQRKKEVKDTERKNGNKKVNGKKGNGGKGVWGKEVKWKERRKEGRIINWSKNACSETMPISSTTIIVLYCVIQM